MMGSKDASLPSRVLLHGSSAFLSANGGCTKVTATHAAKDNDGNKIDDDDAKEKRALQIILDATDDSLDLSLPRNMKGCDLYDRSKEVDDAVETLVSLNRVDRDGAESILSGQAGGVWEVFYAPHIEGLSRPVRVKAKPLRYTVEKNRIVSDVALTTNKPFETQSWWCASGSFTDSKEEVLKFTGFGCRWAPNYRRLRQTSAKKRAIGRLVFVDAKVVREV